MTSVVARDGIDAVLGRLQGVRKHGNSAWSACCPAHEDHNASLSVSIGQDGRILFYCHAGCPVDLIVEKIGLTMRDLMPSNGHADSNSKPKIVKTYDYRDESGALLYQVCRMEPKDFRQRKPKNGGGWDWSVKGVRRVLYRLPELFSANVSETTFVVEGEKDADNLARLGLVATCNVGGAGKWRPEYNESLCGRLVVILTDNDQPGRDHGQQVAQNLQGVAALVKIVELPGLPPKGDVSDWLASGHTADELWWLVDAAPVFKPAEQEVAQSTTLAPGTRVYAGDRGNVGEIVADNGSTCTVHFVNPENGNTADKKLPKSQLRALDGRPIDGTPDIVIPQPIPLRKLVASHPTLRPAILNGLLRVGETMNVVAAPKRGKSWLVDGLALSVAAGCDWLDTFGCTSGRVLILDAELHAEVIAHRLPAVAEAMGLCPDVQDMIDVEPLRGLGVDLLKLRPLIESIEPGRYALVILDAWYRFLPLGFSENDNAQVMALYNTIDSYAATLKAAWVNVHHTSKGDQSGKGTTDVGSGAGSQSRAADTHLIIRQHEQDDVAVIEAVVRSWPPVEPLAIRWTFPIWQLDTEADPRKLRKPRERASRESKDLHLDEDRKAIVGAMVQTGTPQTKSHIRDNARIGNPRFGFAWASLLEDGTITNAGEVRKGNNRAYESFTLAPEQDQ